MSTLSCGCELFGGAPVSPETLKAHYKHTFETVLFWELLCRPFNPSNTDSKLKLSQARIDLINAIDELFPGAREQ